MAYIKSKQDKRDDSTNYASAFSELKKSGPESLYLIWGDEDYLSRQFANSIMNRCLPDGSSDFGYACFDGPEIDAKSFLDFIETPPFMSERSYCELRNIDFGKLEDFEKENIAEIFRNPPEYSSIVVLYYAHQTPDSRLKLIKNLRENGKELIFKEQDRTSLIRWISKRFASYEKEISSQNASYLIDRSGSSMRAIISEIDKIAAYSRTNSITRDDINAVTDTLDEGDVFKLTDQIVSKNYTAAFDNLQKITSLPSFEAIPFVALLASQFRRLYCGKTTGDFKKVIQHTGSGEYMAKMSVSKSRGISAEYLANAVILCADADLSLKTSANDEMTILKSLILDLCNV